MHVFPAMYHAIFHESDRAQVIARVREFRRGAICGATACGVSLREADKYGHTWEEHERLKLRGGPHFAALRAVVKIGGRLSKGIELGWRAASIPAGRSITFTKIAPQGSSRLGPVHRRELSQQHRLARHPAAQSRISKVRCASVIEKLRAEGRPIRILDVAAGAGRYVLETIRALPEVPISADSAATTRTENVAAARALADEFGLRDVTVRRGDAFDRAAVAALSRARRSGLSPGFTSYSRRTTRCWSR